ncbi:MULTISPECIES: hypothetical protein [Ralstonia]|jgi:hypothetical protein|uniref:Uncharacterized protein n=3 Tax=Ralstonia pickettii TaxID=329 RepID=A0AAW4QDK1_RALPI|nr:MULTISPECIES: hypothetical protein [Ralstonia]MBE3066886.1 hypothetical protein [Chloroflexota bacterium]ENZ74826.1 hypothetical protein OR214_05219 [Ralstonia pickettii OR214]MBA9848259.1 hypothetical protein [Ralstonia pickettii]MBA9853770.1 hypothetical protein [Ralstonia pickettii]MBA9921312.1 hypothetical protein [Ralstonia pickettii]
MQSIFAKTFGGLSRPYYFRHFLFGLIFPAFFFFFVSHAGKPAPFPVVLFFIVNTFLYPYARFVYEGVMGFILGSNIFFVNAIVMLFAKFTTMLICWAFAIFIAPIGLVYLYFRHSRA